MTGPSGKRYSPWVILLRYSRVESACPIARDVRYIILYPLLQTSVYSLAMPRCVQSRPIAAKTWPRASDLLSENSLDCQLCYSPIDIRDDDLIRVLPEKDSGCAGRKSRVGRGDREMYGIWTRLQV